MDSVNRAFSPLAMLMLMSLVLSACVSRGAIDRAVNDPGRIKITPFAEISFDPSKTWAVFELASRSARTGIQVFCDMRRTRVYRPRKTTWSGRCEDQRSFTAGTYDGSVFFAATRTRLPDGTLLAIYEIENPLSGMFAPIATSFNANFPLQIFADERPVYEFRRGGVHLLARARTNEAELRQSFISAYPGIESRLSGQIVQTFQPICDGDDDKPTCGVGAEAGIKGPAIDREYTDGTQVILNAETRTSQTETASPTYPEIAGSPPLFEGSSFSAFTPEQLSEYCAQDWSERTDATGRTEYNPCRRRDAFR